VIYRKLLLRSRSFGDRHQLRRSTDYRSIAKGDIEMSIVKTHLQRRMGILALTFAALLIASVQNSFASDTLTNAHRFAPRGTFDSVTVDYGVTQKGQLGMNIHLKFTLYELKGVDSRIKIRFQDSAGNNLKDTNKNFYSSDDGSVSAFYDMKPGYDPAEYSDAQIFMPYSEFDITRAGTYNLRMDIDLVYEDGTLIQHLNFHEFEYSRKGETTPTPASSGNPSATFDRVWVDYDVTSNGQRGLRIHTKFTVTGMKGISGSLRVRFQKADGTYLRSSDGNYEDADGEVAATDSIKPGYDTTVYNDFDVFIPYSEFHLGAGKYDMKMDVDVMDASDGLIQHLTWYDFVYTKNN
jgi:hypothetical protein